MISQEELARLLIYNPATGEFFWQARTPDMFKDGRHSAERTCNNWNSQFANQPAGSPMSKGYIQIRIWWRSYLAHRVAWAMTHGEWPSEIDHKDRNPASNRLDNLRPADRSFNMHNTKTRANMHYPGVSRLSGNRPNPWQASICFNKKRVCLGNFPTPEQAAHAYMSAKGAYRTAVGI